MIVQHPTALAYRTFANAAAFVMCPAAVHGAVPQGLPVPHPMYALAFERARRAVAVGEFRRQTSYSLN